MKLKPYIYFVGAKCLSLLSLGVSYVGLGFAKLSILCGKLSFKIEAKASKLLSS